MDKISNIVRGNSRVASTDLKSSAAVRPGSPSFGRPIAESVAPVERSGTTASRAVALHNELEEKKMMHNDHVVDQMADKFFMTRMRRPIDPEDMPSPAKLETEPELKTASQNEELAPPSGFTPRGSFVDVEA